MFENRCCVGPSQLHGGWSHGVPLCTVGWPRQWMWHRLLGAWAVPQPAERYFDVLTTPGTSHLHVLIPAYKTKFSHWKFVEILILQIFTRFPKCHLTACASGIHSPLSPYCFLYIILPILISAERPSFCKWLVPVASFSKEASKWPSPSWWNCQVLAAVKVISNVSRTVAVNRKVPKACFKYLAKSPTHGVIS